MNAAIVYRPNRRRSIAIAFACAAAIHVGAVACGGKRSHPTSITVPSDATDFMDLEVAPDQPAPEAEEVLPATSVPPTTDDDDFPDAPAPPRPVQPPRRLNAVTRPALSRKMPSAGLTSVRASVIYGPRPAYPYKARRTRITGSGVAVLTINSGGYVMDARMRLSTGSATLDDATIGALGRWRFKPLDVRTVEVPITYTLTGASY